MHSFVSKLWADVKYFWSKKCFAIGIPFMMVASYVTLLVNPTIGIDDTSFSIYYEDGVSPAMGRWCLYLINKFLPLNYNPHFVELVGLSIFCLSITLWCVVFYRMFGDQLPVGVYTIFGMVMLSSPIISEVVIWYLQDGIYLGYGFTALAVLLTMELFRKPKEGTSIKTLHSKLRVGWGVISGAMALVIALGFYEAFMIVFLMAVVMNFMLVHALEKTDYEKRISRWIGKGAVLCICAMLLRMVIVNGITLVDGLQDEAKILETRGLGDIFGAIAERFGRSNAGEELAFVLKDFFVKYYLNALVYTPIMILVLAVIVLGVWSVVHTVRKKDGWILLGAVGILLLPWIMPVIEGVATYYRASQYVPLLSAFAILLVAWECRNANGKWIRGVALVCATFLLYRQGYEMNRWLYVDAMRYEYEKAVMEDIALDIKSDCDTDKPICVVGSFQTPKSLISEVYVPEWSKKNILLKAMIQVLDEDLYDKYNVAGLGYATAETPQLSTIYWGTYAYAMPGSELIKFWGMHGFEFAWDSDMNHYEEAAALMENGPVWPENGYIVEMEDYIIVNLGK